MSKIDDLYRRAFSSGDPTGSDVGWEKMNAILDEKLPVTGSSGYIGKRFYGAAATVLIAAFSLVTSTSHLKQEPANKITVATQEAISSSADNSDISPTQNDVQEVPSARQQTVETNKTSISRETNTQLSVVENKTMAVEEPATQSTEMKQASFFEDRASIKMSFLKPIVGGKLALASNPKLLPWKAKEFKLVNQVQRNQSELLAEEGLQSLVVTRDQEIMQPMDKIQLQSPSNNNSLANHVATDKGYVGLIKGKANLFVGVFGSYDRIDDDNDLNIDVNPEIQNVALVNGENTSLSGGAEVGMNWKGLTASIGAGYSQRVSSYSLYYSHTKSWQEEHVDSYDEIGQIDSVITGYDKALVMKDGKEVMGIIRTNYDIDTSYNTVYDTSYESKSATHSMDGQFRFKVNYVTLPINLGYKHQISRFSVGVNVGLIVNVLSGTSGNMYDPELDQIVVFSDKSRLNPMVYTTQASLQLGYVVTPGVSLIVEPKLVKSLNSTFKDQDPMASTFTGYGANVRLQYEF